MKDHHNLIFPSILKIINKINLRKDSKILDAGCGGGVEINSLYRFGFVNIWGIDISESAVSMAQKDFLNIADRVYKRDAYNSSLPASMPSKYDLIISMEVMEHLYSPSTYLKNCHIWLNKNGYLIITTPYHGYLKNLAIALLNKFDKHWTTLDEGWHIKFFSKKTIEAILRKENFEIKSFKGVGRFPYFWKSMIIVAQGK